ncbi:pirin family protein [Chryseolinea lacunae]|uniref:Pirin family protein n=1 Tax=Chryseolinea lacunae TaxID=2801331 RepID=A0ABS1KRG9_9BACT|nr:pirin family protein [Chryseolinea lacunae]MBL0742075.1 pirin family protein [Chryseolinea lacunae]
MKTVLHNASTRGHANHGWLDSHHSFSFASYHDPKRMHFGVLRVLNDDIVTAGNGFGSHPHDNMEIISIPLKGALQHKDNTGRNEIIKTNDVQIMSAGTGIVHSEYNASKTDAVNFLQIWVFPKIADIAPRYEQKTFDPSLRENKFQVVVSPEANGEGVQINQDAWFSLGSLKKDFTASYDVKRNGNGVYVFVIDGEVTVNGQTLHRRDGLGIADSDTLSITADSNADVLLLDVPLV